MRPPPKPQQPAQKPVPGVEVGDHLYVKHPKRGPIAVRVLCYGKDGLQGECDQGARHKVQWSDVLGHKARMLHRYTLVDQGADGAILADGKGKRRYVEGDVALPAEDVPARPTVTGGADAANKNDDPILGGIGRMRKAIMIPESARVMFVKAAASAIPFRPVVGDRVEFASDMQTEKGPSSGHVISVSDDKSKAVIQHSDHPGEEFNCADVVVDNFTRNRGKERDGRWFLKAAIANRAGLALKDVTDRAGHQTKRWVRTVKDQPKQREPGKDEAGGQPTMKHGDVVAFRHGDVAGRGQIVASGADGVTLQDADGREHRVRHEHLTGQAEKTDEGRDGERGDAEAGREPTPAPATGGGGGEVPPDKFAAVNVYKEFDDPNATPESVLKSFPPDTAEKIADTTKKLEARGQTWDRHRDKDGNWMPERKALHAKIMAKFITPELIKAAKPGEGEKPTFTILGGRGGSGKSWFEHKVYDPKTAVVLDADAIKKELPEFEGWNAAEVHEESGEIFDHLTELAQQLGLNLVHDATMKTAKKAVALVNRFKDAGYRAEAHYMFLPRQEAAKRAIGRFLNPDNGRFVPPEVILENTGNEESFDQVKGLVDSWSFRNNNVAKGEQPKLISEGKSNADNAGSTGLRGLPAGASKDKDGHSGVYSGRSQGAGGGGPGGGHIARGFYKGLGGKGGGVALFLKAQIKGGASVDLFPETVEVGGHMRAGKYIAPFTSTRAKRADPPAAPKPRKPTWRDRPWGEVSGHIGEVEHEGVKYRLHVKHIPGRSYRSGKRFQVDTGPGTKRFNIGATLDWGAGSTLGTGIDYIRSSLGEGHKLTIHDAPAAEAASQPDAVHPPGWENAKTCPSCGYPHTGPKCTNPGCRTNLSAERLAEVDAKAEKDAADEAERRRIADIRNKTAYVRAMPDPEPDHIRTMRDNLARIEGRKSRTASEEHAAALYKQRLAADPAKWEAGHGVRWSVASGGKHTQWNRGFQIAEVSHKDKKARIRQVADTGLTVSGGNDDRLGDEWVYPGDIKRDRKYDAAH